MINACIYDATGAFVTHRDVGWERKGPDEGTSPPLAHDVPTVLPKEGRDLARDRQPIVEHVDCDLVPRDTGEFEGCSHHVRRGILEYVHSADSK